jgi:hypothetical protein
MTLRRLALPRQFPLLIPDLHILLKECMALAPSRGANLKFVAKCGARRFFQPVFWHDPQSAEDNS